MIPIIRNTQNRPVHRDRNYTGSYQGFRKGEQGVITMLESLQGKMHGHLETCFEQGAHTESHLTDLCDGWLR